MTQVMACIDGSLSSLSVCDYATWASKQMKAPLTLLHVLDQGKYPVTGDLSGNIGLGSREHLLAELTDFDAKRAKLALEQGQYLLETARKRAISFGADHLEIKQRHGHFVDSLVDLQDDTRLLVIGRVGESSSKAGHQVGSHLETTVRTIHRPILIAASTFKEPERVLLAFDGSATGYKTVQILAESSLCQNLPIHLVMAGAESNDSLAHLQKAKAILVAAGFDVNAEIRQGEVEPTLHAYQTEHRIDLLVMGAYGHSRIREFFVGSTTTTMLRTVTMPLLLLR